MRTKVQREANEIDMELYRLVTRLERLAEEVKGKSGAALLQSARQVQTSRYAPRDLMHPDDVDATRYS